MQTRQYTVLGSRGFIGGRLLAALRRTGASCYAPARGEPEVFTRELGVVFYCVGLTGDYADRPFDAVEAHVGFLSRVLAEASFSQVIYLSSTRLYDSRGESNCTEDSDLLLNPANPRHLYDLSKALGESLCLTASGARGRVARLSNVYDDAQEATGFLPSLLRRLRNERRFALDAGSGAVRDYIHVNDVVRGLVAFADDPRGGIVNLASGESLSNGEIVDILNSRGFDITLQRQVVREARPTCDIARMRRLGVEPQKLRAYLEGLPDPSTP